jgi:deazaflavin-dependent oxidoreductase (nitroreductase family)
MTQTRLTHRLPPLPRPGSRGTKIVNAVTRLNVALYRATDGRLGARAFGAPVLLLDHVGRKSGQLRTTPLLFVRNGVDLLVVGSRGGSDHTPSWWRNLEANPRTTVTVDGKRREIVARLAIGAERERLWAIAVAAYPAWQTYQDRTERELELVVLGPRSSASTAASTTVTAVDEP